MKINNSYEDNIHQTPKFKTDSKILKTKHSFKISEEKYEDKRRVITRKYI